MVCDHKGVYIQYFSFDIKVTGECISTWGDKAHTDRRIS